MARTLNEFMSTLHPTTRHMMASIAEEWVTAGGSWDEPAVTAMLHDFTDDELAAECVEEFDLGKIRGGENESHMRFNDYSHGDLAEAFCDMR